MIGTEALVFRAFKSSIELFSSSIGIEMVCCQTSVFFVIYLEKRMIFPLLKFDDPPFQSQFS